MPREDGSGTEAAGIITSRLSAVSPDPQVQAYVPSVRPRLLIVVLAQVKLTVNGFPGAVTCGEEKLTEGFVDAGPRYLGGPCFRRR
jgi:hypothetical protein